MSIVSSVSYKSGNPKGTNCGGGPRGKGSVVKCYHPLKNGQIWRELRNRCDLMKGWKSSKGYQCYTIWGKSVEGHLLVGRKWLPNPENKPQLDHINRCRSDNRVENLRWVTRQENCKNRVFGGTEQQAVSFLEGLGYTLIPPQ